MCFNKLEKKNAPPFFENMIGILGILSLTRGLNNPLHWVFRNGADKQTDKHGDSMTDSAQRTKSVKNK